MRCAAPRVYGVVAKGDDQSANWREIKTLIDVGGNQDSGL